MAQVLSRLFLASILSALAFSATAQQPLIVSLDIIRFQVDGNTVLPTPVIDKLLAPFTGEDREFSDIRNAQNALQAAYRERGFELVQVTLPEQELNEGVVHLKVVEVRIGAVIVEGNRFLSAGNIRNSVPSLRAGENLNVSSASSSLKLTNANPAKKTTLQLQTAAQEGEVDAVLRVTDEKPWRLGLNLDNTGDDATGNTHLGVLYQHANINGFDQVLSLQYTTTAEHPSQVSVYSAGYHIPLYGLGDSIDLYATYSDVNAGTVTTGLFDLQVSGKGRVAGARYSHELPRIGNYESTLFFGLDYKAFQSNVQITEFSGLELGTDVTARPFSVGYASSWTLPRARAGFYLNAARNVPGGENGRAIDFERARSGASDDYGVLRFGASLGQTLPGDWQLVARIAGQYTRDALIPGEQFGIAGSTAVRGFSEREVADDRGVLGSMEIHTPNLFTGSSQYGVQCRALAFFDAATASRNKALPGETADTTISSAGVGVRVTTDPASLQLEYGRVVDGIAGRASGDDRLHLKLTLSY